VHEAKGVGAPPLPPPHPTLPTHLDAVAGRGSLVREPEQDFAAFRGSQQPHHGEASDQTEPPRHELRDGEHLEMCNETIGIAAMIQC
jgi:hypothetical protein